MYFMLPAQQLMLLAQQLVLLDWQLMLLAQQQKIFNGGKKLFDAEGLFLVLGDNAFCPFCVFLLFRWDLKIIFA